MDFEAGKEFRISNIGIEKIKIYRQNPEENGYYTISEVSDFLQIGFYESRSGYKNVDWFVVKVIKIEKKNFVFKNTSKDIIMSDKDKKLYRDNNICRFYEKKCW